MAKISIPNLLSIAGSDPGGGAGVQADLKTFAALHCYGMAAITALTAQNTKGVFGVHMPPPDFLGAQLQAIFSDIKVASVKIGMLGNAANADRVADCLMRYTPPIVVLDPVLVATSGDALGAPDLVAALVARLLPLATLVTPNLPEAARLTHRGEPNDEAEMIVIGQQLLAMGAKAVLVKGGHLAGPEAIDVLVTHASVEIYRAPKIAVKNVHGTGCTLSSAIAAYLAHGLALGAAVAAAKKYVSGALAQSPSLDVGQGAGPVHHFHKLWGQPSRQGLFEGITSLQKGG